MAAPDNVLASADRALIFDYLAWRTRQGLFAGAATRACCSCCGPSTGQLVRRGRDRADDPTALLDPPKLPRALPRRCRRARSTRCWPRPTWTPRWACAIARMLELMYACGLRVERAGRPGRRRRQPAPGRAARAGQGQQGADGAAGARNPSTGCSAISTARARSWRASAGAARGDGRTPLFIDAARPAAEPAGVLGAGEALRAPGRDRRRQGSARTACATASPPTCSTPRRGPALAAANAGATARCPPPRSTPWSPASICSSCMRSIIRGGERPARASLGRGRHRATQPRHSGSHGAAGAMGALLWGATVSSTLAAARL